MTTTIEITLCNRARLYAAEWAVWAEDFKSFNSLHHVQQLVFVDPATLQVYCNVELCSESEVAKKNAALRGLTPTLTEMAERWVNRPNTLVPIKGIFRNRCQQISSLCDDFELVELFTEWYESEDVWSMHDIYEDLLQRYNIDVVRPRDPILPRHMMNDDMDIDMDIDMDMNDEDFYAPNTDEERNRLVAWYIRRHHAETVARIEETAYHGAVARAIAAISTVYQIE